MVICVEQGADLRLAQLMPLPLAVSCFSESQTGFTFLVPAHPGSPGLRAVKRVCVCMCVRALLHNSKTYYPVDISIIKILPLNTVSHLTF